MSLQALAVTPLLEQAEKLAGAAEPTISRVCVEENHKVVGWTAEAIGFLVYELLTQSEGPIGLW